MKCYHCKQELGNGDEYDLMVGHRWSCNSKVGNAMMKSLENEFNGILEDY